MSTRINIHAGVLLIVLAAITTLHINVLSRQTKMFLNMELSSEGSASRIAPSVGAFERVGEDVEVPDSWIRALQTRNILMRDYRRQGGRYVNLTVVVAGASRRSLHFPEVCLRGQGNEIREQYVAPVGISFMSRRLVLVDGGRSTAVIYWFKVGDLFTDNFFVNSWHWALGQLMQRPAKSAMIRLSAVIGPDGAEAAFDELEDFALALEPDLREKI